MTDRPDPPGEVLKLKPCPFCGETPEEEPNFPGTFSHPYCDGECPAHDADLRFPDQYAAWNRRPAEPARSGAKLTIEEVLDEIDKRIDHQPESQGGYWQGLALDRLSDWIEERVRESDACPECRQAEHKMSCSRSGGSGSTIPARRTERESDEDSP